MRNIKKTGLATVTLVIATALLAGCEKVGSESWCKKLEAKDKGDWTANELRDYTKYCVLKLDPDKEG